MAETPDQTTPCGDAGCGVAMCCSRPDCPDPLARERCAVAAECRGELRPVREITGRIRTLAEARLAAMKARFGPPSGWPRPGYPIGWHMERPCTPEEASHHDNGCVDAARAIGALMEAEHGKWS